MPAGEASGRTAAWAYFLSCRQSYDGNQYLLVGLRSPKSGPRPVADRIAPLPPGRRCPRTTPTTVGEQCPLPDSIRAARQGADSSGVRKKLSEPLRWFHKSERLAGAVVEAAGEASEILGRVNR